MMLDIRHDVFVVGVRAGKRTIVWMGLRIIPCYFLIIMSKLIPVIFNNDRSLVK